MANFNLQPGARQQDASALTIEWRPLDFDTATGYTPQTGTCNFNTLTGGAIAENPQAEFDLQPSQGAEDPEALSFEWGQGPTRTLDFNTSGQAYFPPLAVVDFPRNSTQQATWPWEPPPALNTRFGLPWGEGGNLEQGSKLRWSEVATKDADTTAAWDGIPQADQGVAVRWGEIPTKDTDSKLLWEQAAFPADQHNTTSWGDPKAKDDSRQLGWDESVQARDQWDALLWGDPPPKDLDKSFNWRSTIEHPVSVPSESYEVENGDAVAFDLETSGVPENPTELSFEWLAGSHKTSGRTEATNSRGLLIVPWGDAARKDTPKTLPWGQGNPSDGSPFIPWDIEEPEEEPDLPDRIPEQRTYTVDSSLTVVRTSDSKDIKVLSAGAGLSLGDFAWRARIAIGNQQGLDDLAPSGGSNQEAIITINGQAIWVIVESWKRDSVFGKTAWVATCRGVSAELDAPYFGERDFISTGNSTAAQLAGDELNGTGWTINWPAGLDYTIDAGKYSYQGLTPIRSVARLAAAIGAVVVPEPDSRALNIVSRLEHKPSEWALQTPAAIVPQSAVVSIGHQYEPRPEYDYIQVSGGTDGVTVEATKQGEPGNKPAPDIVNPLILDSTTGQELARVELYSSGPRATDRRQWPILAPVSMRMPTELIRNDDDDGEGGTMAWFGHLQDVQVSGAWGNDGLACWQSVTQHRYDV